MAIADYNTYKARRDAPTQRIRFGKNDPATSGYNPSSTWVSWGGSAPTTAVVPTEATTGALGQRDPSGTLRLLRVILSFNPGSNTLDAANITATGSIILYDRLSHQGGLSGTSAIAQTTNLPTAALTRRTSGVGVFGWCEVYTALGSSTTTLTCSYTNHAGTSGRTSPAIAWGGTGVGQPSAVRVINFLPLQAGDRGMRAIASVTAAATTGTAGNFGVTLGYPILALPIGLPREIDAEALFGFGGWFPQIDTDACLSFMVAASQFIGPVTGEFHLAED